MTKRMVVVGQFSAYSLSAAARRAAYALGMRTVRSFDILDHESLEDAMSRDPATPMLRLYNRKAELELTAGDLYESLANLEPSAEPMARALPR